jgi:hypothetical protein
VGPRAVLDAVVKRKIPRETMIKVKVKLSLRLTMHHAKKTYLGSGHTAPRILDLGARLR